LNIYEYYGAHRVIEPAGALPQAADRIDNDPEIRPSELLIGVKALQLTATAVNSLMKKCGENTKRIEAEIFDIVNSRGKFQDPVTKSGGILIGNVKKIGGARKDRAALGVGDKIATLVSLSLTPLRLY
jgi:L-erythro-3,5-diaminohexanoate dehydrogenase